MTKINITPWLSSISTIFFASPYIGVQHVIIERRHIKRMPSTFRNSHSSNFSGAEVHFHFGRHVQLEVLLMSTFRSFHRFSFLLGLTRREFSPPVLADNAAQIHSREQFNSGVISCTATSRKLSNLITHCTGAQSGGLIQMLHMCAGIVLTGNCT